MNKSILFILCLFFSMAATAQKRETKLLNEITISQLKQEPYAAWYSKNHEDYQPSTQFLEALKKTNPSKYTMKIFFGSWCGDSKRELPKMTKVLEKLSFSQKNLTLIGVDDSTEVYKQSPQRQEAGLNIFRVPTFIIYENGKEIGRIVEYPTETIERDLLRIFAKKEYIANYFGYPQIIQWMKDGLLTDENISARGLAMQLKNRIGNESELNACGYVLLAQGNLKEAVAVLRINANLFPQSANCWDSLGEAYAKSGLNEKAIQAYEYVLELDPKSENAKTQLLKLKG
jgi:thiol-disulfide isomerase/thioredoxin